MTAVQAALLLCLGRAAQEKASVTAEVVDARTGQPVEGVLVRLIERFPPQEADARIEERRTGRDGRASFAGVRRGTYQLTPIEAPEGYALEQGPPVTVADDLSIRLRMSPAVRVAGRVKVSDPKRLPVVAVHVLQQNGTARIARYVDVASDGTFLLDRLNRDVPAVITVKSAGAHDRQRVLHFRRDERSRDGVDFSIAPYDPARISIRGRALLGATPLAGKAVAVTRSEPLDGILYAHAAFTDESGAYEVPDLPPGPYTVQLIDAGGTGKPRDFPIRKVVVPAEGVAAADFLLP